MPLPTSDITTSMVRNAIGENTNSVFALRTSNKNNFWGFAKGYTHDSEWGRNPPAPHDLGDYRGYDHYWRCWALDELDDKSVMYEDNTYFDVQLRSFPSWSVQDGTNHILSVEFKRTNDYHQGVGTFLETDLIFNNQTNLPISFNNAAPPDGGAALTPGQTVYIRITHKSSNIRRWDDRESMLPPSWQVSEGVYIIPIVIQEKGWTNYIYIYDRTIIAYKDGSSVKVRATVNVSNDNPASREVYWKCETSPSPTFSTDKLTITGYYNAAGQPIPKGGGVISTDIEIGSSQLYVAGQTLYYKLWITAVSSGTFSTNVFTGSIIVSATLPID